MPVTSHRGALEGRDLGRYWGWYLALGIALAGLGMLAIGSSVASTFVSVLVFGWALIVGGALSIVHAIWHRRREEGVFFHIVTGALYLVVGVMSVTQPMRSALALTLVLAVFLVFEGMFRIIASIAVRPPQWGWLLAAGVVSLLLGVVIWAQWPVSGLWVLGLFVGIELLVSGVTVMLLAFASRVERPRRAPEEHAPPRREAPIAGTEIPAH